MAKVSLDGDTSGKTNKPVAKKEAFNVRLDAFAGKEDLNPEDCPKGMKPVLCAKNTRIACLSGNVYSLAANKVGFVHERDVDFCASKGAAVQDAAAIALRKQAEADAAELQQLRDEKAAADKAAADKAAADKAAADKKAK